MSEQRLEKLPFELAVQMAQHGAIDLVIMNLRAVLSQRGLDSGAIDKHELAFRERVRRVLEGLGS